METVKSSALARGQKGGEEGVHRGFEGSDGAVRAVVRVEPCHDTLSRLPGRTPE